MSKQLLLGDEAIAQAALDAGLSGVYAYPGTPSTEITEYIQTAAITGKKVTEYIGADNCFAGYDAIITGYLCTLNH